MVPWAARLMGEDGTGALTTVFDAATRKRAASLMDDLPARLAELESQGVGDTSEAVERLCAEMERQGEQVRGLILRQPPRGLLGYVYAMHHMTIFGEMAEQGEAYRPNKGVVDEMQFLLEHVHAAWSSSAVLPEESRRLDEGEVAELLEALRELRSTTLLYCMMRSQAMAAATGDRAGGERAMRAMTAWVSLRGRRYQVLEEEFLGFVLAPHDDALRRCYGMGARAIAAGVQAIADSMRTGFSDAAERVEREVPSAEADGLEEVDRETIGQVREAFDDMLNGGICNLSRHAKLARGILEDLSFRPGENVEFLAEGPLRGTPLRTLPALVRPGIRLGDDYYVADGQFVRDVAYRTIQRGMLVRDRGYREGWNQRQKRMAEDALPKIFAPQLKGAACYRSVFYRDPETDAWAETDLVVVLEDVLVVVEAKAGVMAMDSPAVDFDRHMAGVERLIAGAYRQCRRFLDYLASGSRVPIHRLEGGRYRKVADLRLGDFRLVLPIGLTVESLSPFSTCLNDVEASEPLLGRHGFMSMSIDDLFVLRRFLRTAGELLHYLEVRQAAGGIQGTVLLDETEHLGAYIARNRFDATLRAQREESGLVVWNAYADIVDRYFEGENAGTGPAPSPRYPRELEEVLRLLDRKRPRGWLAMDAAVRNFAGPDRDRLGEEIGAMRESLGRHPCRWLGLLGAEALQVCVCAAGSEPSAAEVRRRAEAACIVAKARSIRVLRLSYGRGRRLANVGCRLVEAPAEDRRDRVDLQREAAAQAARMVVWEDGLPDGADGRGA